jgi:6-phosphogluconolactonase (cycloisomerase 2 family)
VFALDSETGRLRAVACPLSGGKTPRFFAIDPSQRFVYVANEDSDGIRMFRIESDKGTLASTDAVVQVGSPVCIVFSQSS